MNEKAIFGHEFRFGIEQLTMDELGLMPHEVIEDFGDVLPADTLQDLSELMLDAGDLLGAMYGELLAAELPADRIFEEKGYHFVNH